MPLRRQGINQMNWYTVKLKYNKEKINVAVKAKSSKDALIRIIKELPESTRIKSVFVKKEDLVK